ncbi:MAG: hypothetical protein ACKPKO_09230, partial [Candidatus Fonsibacter sp.]
TQIICNKFEPTTVNTDMIIKNPIGYYLEILIQIHYYQVPSLISTRLLNFTPFFCDNVAVGYTDANDMFVTRFFIDKKGNAYTYGNFDVTGNLSASNMYNKTQVDNLVSGKQNTLIFRAPTQLNPLVQGFPLLGGGNIVPGISAVPPLRLTYYGNDYIEIDIGLSQKAVKSTTYTKSEVETIASTRQAIITSATSFDANNASFVGNISTRIWTSPTTWVEQM